MFVYFIVYRDFLNYTQFTEKICPRHFRRWAGLHVHTRKKKQHEDEDEACSPMGGLIAHTRKKNMKTLVVQELQAFAFSVVTVNDEHTKPRFKIKRRG